MGQLFFLEFLSEHFFVWSFFERFINTNYNIDSDSDGMAE